ncbi:MAG: flagellar type III secretion system pore protein FliP [Rhodothalassiaceae bacterium]
MTRWLWFFLAVLAAALASTPALGQELSVDLGAEGTLTGRVIQLLLLITVISLAPSILLTMTSFTRIVVVLSILRSALGTQSTPPNVVLIALALFLTGFIMWPALEQSYQQGIEPLIDERIDAAEGIRRSLEPMKRFMLANVRERDLALFLNVQGGERPATPEDVGVQVLVPAFLISELRRAFEIAFLLYVPFIVIDLVVASILMSMGMMMLPPILISLPFKLIFFVLVDGWTLLAGNLIEGFDSGLP